jgi:hypothetical protein
MIFMTEALLGKELTPSIFDALRRLPTGTACERMAAASLVGNSEL